MSASGFQQHKNRIFVPGKHQETSHPEGCLRRKWRAEGQRISVTSGWLQVAGADASHPSASIAYRARNTALCRITSPLTSLPYLGQTANRVPGPGAVQRPALLATAAEGQRAPTPPCRFTLPARCPRAGRSSPPCRPARRRPPPPVSPRRPARAPWRRSSGRRGRAMRPVHPAREHRHLGGVGGEDPHWARRSRDRGQTTAPTSCHLPERCFSVLLWKLQGWTSGPPRSPIARRAAGGRDERRDVFLRVNRRVRAATPGTSPRCSRTADRDAPPIWPVPSENIRGQWSQCRGFRSWRHGRGSATPSLSSRPLSSTRAPSCLAE